MERRNPKGRKESPSWAKLEDFLLGRTFHVHSLSPLSSPTVLFDDSHSQNDPFSSSQLDKIAKQLHSFLSIRLTNTLQTIDNRTLNEIGSTTTGTIRRLRKGFIRAVRASFVELPLPLNEQDIQTDHSNDSIPKPWGIEIEIQPPESNTNPFSSLTDRSKPQTQKAHILFLSNGKFATSTHYPILLWKAPPSAIYTEEIGSQQQSRSDGQNEAIFSKMNASSTENTVSVTSRMLMAHVLDFISRFFDCRVSQEAPLCSIRGENLERMSEAILQFHRLGNEKNERSSFDNFGIDLGFALPTQILCDLPQNGNTIEDGPAPHLNLISLTVPAKDVKALMTGTRQGKDLFMKKFILLIIADLLSFLYHKDKPILPGIQQYLALHASLQLNRLTLVRAGIANIFIGVPTATTLISSTGQISGEVRLKIAPIGRGQTDRRTQISTQQIGNVERERIRIVLRQLILLSEKDDW